MISEIMLLHSMCHPGLPGPQGLGQLISPGLADFQSAKSAGPRFRESTSTRSPALRTRSGRSREGRGMDGEQGGKAGDKGGKR